LQPHPEFRRRTNAGNVTTDIHVAQEIEPRGSSNTVDTSIASLSFPPDHNYPAV